MFGFASPRGATRAQAAGGNGPIPFPYMARDLPIGNGDLLVNFDEFYQVRDMYYPRVGAPNHTQSGPDK